MDDKFRLVFTCPEQVPSAQAYLDGTAIVCERLREAVGIGCEMNYIWRVPFIAHRYVVFEPFTIDLLYRELVVRHQVADGATPTSS